MDKAIECGIRIDKVFLELDDSKFEAALPLCVTRFKSILIAQRKRFNAIQAIASSKSFEDSWATKGVELYCRFKSMDDAHIQEEKSWARAIGLIATRVECGVRVKQYVFESPQDQFEKHLTAAAEVFEASVKEQRAAYQELKDQKSLDLTGDLKDVELYCEWKSICGD